MNNKWIKTLIIWALLFAAIIWMVTGMDTVSSKPDELDYNTDFLSLVQRTEASEEAPAGGEKTIKAIQVTYRDIYGLYGDSKLTLKDLEKHADKKADFHVVIPSETTFRSDMAAIVFAANPGKYQSVDEIASSDYSFAYEATVVKESVWSIILPSLIVVVAFAVFYFFLIRQQGGGKQMMNFGKSRARIQLDDKNRVTFNDVRERTRRRES